MIPSHDVARECLLFIALTSKIFVTASEPSSAAITLNSYWMFLFVFQLQNLVS